MEDAREPREALPVEDTDATAPAFLALTAPVLMGALV
jgi:hypothetical protein